MRVFVGFDDTDNIDADRGTGKLARWFENELPDQCRLIGVVRQQLLVDPAIPYTSHNSAACVILDAGAREQIPDLIHRAANHVEALSFDGSDPGVCVAAEDDAALDGLIAFGRTCGSRVRTQGEAMKAANGAHLSGHGGTNDGIIGAAAAVGLTAGGWGGRFIEFNGLRDFPDAVTVAELERSRIHVISVDREAKVPSPDDVVNTKGWLRPGLCGGEAVLLVKPQGPDSWETLAEKKRKKAKTS